MRLLRINGMTVIVAEVGATGEGWIVDDLTSPALRALRRMEFDITRDGDPTTCLKCGWEGTVDECPTCSTGMYLV